MDFLTQEWMTGLAGLLGLIAVVWTVGAKYNKSIRDINSWRINTDRDIQSLKSENKELKDWKRYHTQSDNESHTQIMEEIKEVNKKLGSLCVDVAVVKTDVSTLKGDVQSLKEKVK